MNFRAAWRKLEHGPQAKVAFILDCRSIPPPSPFADAVVQHEVDVTEVHSEPEKAGRCRVRLLWNCKKPFTEGSAAMGLCTMNSLVHPFVDKLSTIVDIDSRH